MTPSECQKLAEFIGKKFDESNARLARLEVSHEALRRVSAP